MIVLNNFTLISRVKHFISFFLLIRVALSAGITPTYCSNQNLGSGDPDTSIYQSLGNCQSTCKANYAYAIVQGQSCWCSNSAPTDRESLDKCSDTCPGYPFETCGNVASGLYNYLALEKATASPSTLATSSRTAASPQTTSLITDVTVTQEDSATTTSKATISPITTQSLQTVGGTIVTRTVTFMPSESSNASSQLPTAKSKMSTGSIVAIAVAVVVAAVVLLLAIIIGLCCYRRKKARRELDGEDATSSNIQRNTSVLSKAGLLGAVNGGSNASGSPERRAEAMSERRSSKLQVFDQRLNPTAFMQHDDGSRSRFVSMQDNRDYTRTLNVRNPDPAD